MDASNAPDNEPILDRKMVGELLDLASLNPFFRSEEISHPWRPMPLLLFSDSTYDQPFMRVWDQFSGSQHECMNGMSSRAPRDRLDTFDSRQQALTIHANHKDWRPTPFISFTTSPAAIKTYASRRIGKDRGDQTLTVIDPKVRLSVGLPICDMAAEMARYQVADPYNFSGQYYEDEYVCLWQVFEKEIIGQWNWKDISESPGWFKEIILPAFRNFRNQPTPQIPRERLGDLSIAMDRLCITNDSPSFSGEGTECSSTSSTEPITQLAGGYDFDSDEEARSDTDNSEKFECSRGSENEADK